MYIIYIQSHIMNEVTVISKFELGLAQYIKYILIAGLAHGLATDSPKVSLIRL